MGRLWQQAVPAVLGGTIKEGEKDLEQFYLNFAQPNNLATKQCMVMAVRATKDDTAASQWSGLRGKLSKLQSGAVNISYNTPAAGAKV
eukprot:jgi/Chrzof1/12051/Cz06g19160.t1